MVAVAVAVAVRDVGAPTFVDLSRPVANSAGIQGADAVVDVIADAIGIRILCARTTTDAEGIELIAVAVAVPIRDVCAPTFVDVPGSVADSAGIEGSDTVVDIVADAIGISIS